MRRWFAARGVVAWDVANDLLATLGLYGATLVVAFIAGMFPLFSIEAFLFWVATWPSVDPATLAVLIALAAFGHQVAKTVTYYAGAGVFELPRGKVRERIAAARRRIERWNRWPRLFTLAAAVVGVPPLYLFGFIAQPLFGMPIATFTAISLAGRVARYTIVVVAAQLI
jgi:membrane protein YqaA with SNARE-associated domain